MDAALQAEAMEVAGQVVEALAGIAEEHGDPLVIAVTLQVMAAKAQQARAGRKEFLRSAGMAYDAVEQATPGGRA